MGMFSGPGNFGVVRCKMPAKCAVKCQLPRLYCSSLLGSGGIGSQGCRREKDRFVGGQEALPLRSWMWSAGTAATSSK